MPAPSLFLFLAVISKDAMPVEQLASPRHLPVNTTRLGIVKSSRKTSNMLEYKKAARLRSGLLGEYELSDLFLYGIEVAEQFYVLGPHVDDAVNDSKQYSSNHRPKTCLVIIPK